MQWRVLRGVFLSLKASSPQVGGGGEEGEEITCEGDKMKQSRVSELPPVIRVKLDQMDRFSGFALFAFFPPSFLSSSSYALFPFIYLFQAAGSSETEQGREI